MRHVGSLLPDLRRLSLPALRPLWDQGSSGILSTQHQDLLISGELFWDQEVPE